MNLETFYERVPKVNTGWRCIRPPDSIPKDGPTLRVSRWLRGKVIVISCVDIAQYPDESGEGGPHWHLSISHNGKRASEREVRAVLRDFAVPKVEGGAREDNHHPTQVRHFWVPIDPARRRPCPCQNETVVVERDGFKWANEQDPDKCRGCEWEVLWGTPCGLHGKKPAAVAERRVSE